VSDAVADGLFLKRARAGAALASSVCGQLAVVGWYIARKLELVSLHEVYIGLLVGMGVYLSIALPGPRENQVPS
jgi:Na+/pantothenate symporter